MFLNFSRHVALIAAIASIFAIAPLKATPITGSPFTGFVSPDVSIDFEAGAIADNVFITTQFSGVNFTGGAWGMTTSSFGQNAVARHLRNLGGGSPTAILFDNNVTDAGFNWQTNTGTTTFSAFLDNVFVEDFTVATNTSNPNNFFGFENSLFDEIRISINILPQGFELDNLQFNSEASEASEPGTLAVFGLGLLGIGYIRRRKAV
jgi:hypothetical protein